MYWNYTYLTKSGQEITETHAGRMREIHKIVNERNGHLMSIKMPFKENIQRLLNKKKLSSRVLSTFFMDFSELYSAGITINETFQIMKETTNDLLMLETIQSIKKDIAKGFTLTQAIEQTKRFPWLIPSVINAGEKGGQLPSVLSSLARYYDRKDKIISQIIKASGYPLFVLSLLISLLVFVSFKVIPQLQTLIPANSAESPATLTVLIISHVIQSYWWIFLAVAAGFIIFVNYVRVNKTDQFNHYLYKLPVVGEILKNLTLSLYFLNISLMVKSGIPLLDTFQNLTRVTGNVFVTKQFMTCCDYIVGGCSFWEAVQKVPFFPKITAYTIRVGEESGNLNKSLADVTNYFENAAVRKTNLLLSLIQPTLVMVCGGFIVLLAFAFLVPIYGNLTNIAGGGTS